MARYHINPETGRPNVCRAKTPDACKYAKDGETVPHYDSKEEARAGYEKEMESEMVSTLSERTEVKYSFLDDFAELEKEHNAEFDGVPTRFFSQDFDEVRENIPDMSDELSAEYVLRGYYNQKMNKVFIKAMAMCSTPSKDSNVDSPELSRGLEELGATDIRKVSDSAVACRMNGHSVLIREKAQGKPGEQYMFKYGIPYEGMDRSFYNMDARHVMGAIRAHRLTGENVLQASMQTRMGLNKESAERLKDNPEAKKALKHMQNTASVIVASQVVDGLEDAQYRGGGFRAQKKFIRDANNSIATVWTDKKNPSEAHVRASTNSPLNKHFRKIEIDNDVSLTEFKDFENSFESVKDKLPPLPEGLQPELRVRKLGKHNSSTGTVLGLYNPALNAVAVDVRNASATIHELGHYYDITTKNNASLSPEFQEIVKEYSKGLKGKDIPSKSVDYYTVPTEVFARGFEMYASKKLGITQTKLLDEGRFSEGVDYSPFVENPELQERVFSFIEKNFKK